MAFGHFGQKGVGGSIDPPRAAGHGHRSIGPGARAPGRAPASRRSAAPRPPPTRETTPPSEPPVERRTRRNEALSHQADLLQGDKTKHGDGWVAKRHLALSLACGRLHFKGGVPPSKKRKEEKTSSQGPRFSGFLVIYPTQRHHPAERRLI